MTTSSVTFIPDPRTADDEPEPAPALRPVPAPAPQDVTRTSPDDAVILPRHIADAAYHVLQAMNALKDNGANELFHALGKALNKGSQRAHVELAPPCEECHVDVAFGLLHLPECRSEEAAVHRSKPFPQVDPSY
jgi:hypothetical protein